MEKREDNSIDELGSESSDHDQCFHFIDRDRFIVVNSNHLHKNGCNYNNNKYINIFVFNKRTSNYHKKYSNLKQETFATRIQINIETNTYKIDYLPNIGPPQIELAFIRPCHVVFCTKSQTVHIFTYKFDKHYSISVEYLFSTD